MRASNSALDIGVIEKLREYSAFFWMRVQGLINPPDFEWIFQQIREYEEVCRDYGGFELKKARALEIGFGARPNRLLALTSLGYDVRGADLDRPILDGQFSEFWQCYKKNGAERTAKSLVRWHLFDWMERRALINALAKRGAQLEVDRSRFIVSDVRELQLPPNSVDFILSEDVFEHLPVDTVEKTLENISCWLSRDGVALIRPCVFTGIAGGHLSEWFHARVSNKDLKRRSDPWEHLRKRRFTGNVYLNELTLADYRKLFSKHLQIRTEKVMAPNLGREWLTSQVRDELCRYPEEELLSNNVLFILQKQ